MATLDPADNRNDLILFFQHFDDDLWYAQLQWSSWQGDGVNQSLGVYNAVNGMSIAATSYTYNSILTVSKYAFI